MEKSGCFFEFHQSKNDQHPNTVNSEKPNVMNDCFCPTRYYPRYFDSLIYELDRTHNRLLEVRQ